MLDAQVQAAGARRCSHQKSLRPAVPLVGSIQVRADTIPSAVIAVPAVPAVQNTKLRLVSRGTTT